MDLTVKHLFRVAAAIAIAAPALLGTAASPAAAAVERAHCDRAQQDMWDDGPSRTITAHRCGIPSHGRRWYTVEIDTLVQTHHKGDSLDGPADRTKTLHRMTIRCLGHTSDEDADADTGAHTGADADAVIWFGCPPL
ncbi:hypothetical protein ABZ858_20335 [Streptomyces sp. NPDC047017]|uniref:hypothetical protein n=1 Tax=Streptomyces sp. NPDC047017 TaxID=3155024 RepID=UPI0033C08C7C